jgi:hypothetical protein
MEKPLALFERTDDTYTQDFDISLDLLHDGCIILTCGQVKITRETKWELHLEIFKFIIRDTR